VDIARPQLADQYLANMGEVHQWAEVHEAEETRHQHDVLLGHGGSLAGRAAIPHDSSLGNPGERSREGSRHGLLRVRAITTLGYRVILGQISRHPGAADRQRAW